MDTRNPGIRVLMLGLLALGSLSLVMPPTSGPTHAVASTSATALPPVTEADGRLGTCYAFYTPELPPLAYNAGSRWDRFDFRWNVIEPVRGGNLNLDGHEAVVNRDLAHGLNVVGILGSTAAWATSNCVITQVDVAALQELVPGHPRLEALAASDNAIAADAWWRPCPPHNLYLPWNHPDNHWGSFVYRIVSHFKGKVDVWQMWNEPDLWTVFWTGTPAEYAQLLRVGYQAAKAANPQATVLFAGQTYWANPTFHREVFDALRTLEGAAQNNYYFDAMALQLYSNVYSIGSVVGEVRQTMVARVGPHPMWITETGVPLWDEHPSAPGVRADNYATIEEAAAYVIQAYAEARAAQVERFFFFRTHDDYMTDAFGLIRNDYSLRPAYVALQVAARYLRGENQITGPFTNSGVRRITFWGTPHGRVDVLWNTTPTPLSYTHPAILPHATLVNHRGQTQALAAQNGNFTIPLEPATAWRSDGLYFIGGPPVLLLQEDTQPPSTTLQALPRDGLSTTAPLAWQVSDAGSGYWYAEIQRAPAATGPWTQIAGWAETRDGQTGFSAPLPGPGIWYFRIRSRDRAGNWEPWPATAQAQTSRRSVTVHISAFLDENGDGVWDAGEPAAPAATRIQWVDPWGRLVHSGTLGSEWQATALVDAGPHRVYLIGEEHLGHSLLTVPDGAAPLTLTRVLGLRPIVGRSYLPLVWRSP